MIQQKIEHNFERVSRAIPNWTTIFLYQSHPSAQNGNGKYNVIKLGEFSKRFNFCLVSQLISINEGSFLWNFHAWSDNLKHMDKDTNNRGILSVHCIISAISNQFISLQKQAKHIVKARDIDKGRYTAVVFIDLKKAFDTVDHEILLNKLNYYGVRGKELSWFRSYLFNRKQFCRVNGHSSVTEGVDCGVPQGSCLGPLLFLVYVNDLPYCLKTSDVAMYADDTTIYYSSPSMTDINTAINADLEALRGWLEGNKLSLNVVKTQGMIIGRRCKLLSLDLPSSSKPDLNIGSEEITMANNTKYLGLQVDDQLKWSTHLSNTIKKVSRGIGMLKFSKRYLPKESLIMLYRSLIEPYFRYCCPVWGSCGASVLDKLQKLQNRAARIVTNSPYDASALPLIGSLGWLTIRELIDFETSKMVYKSLNALAPDYLRNLFQKVSEATNSQLRNSKTDLRLPLLRTSTGQKSFAYRGAKVWSDLDSVVKASASFSSF